MCKEKYLGAVMMIPKRDVEALDEYASERGLTRSACVRDAIRRFGDEGVYYIREERGHLKSIATTQVNLWLGRDISDKLDGLSKKLKVSRTSIIRTCIKKIINKGECYYG